MNLRGYFFTTCVGALAYWILLHQLHRENFASLLVLYTVVFAIYLYLLKTTRQTRYFVLPLVLFHGIALFASPNLSDDYWRFLWDGHLTAQGISPYLYTPNELMQLPLKDSFLHALYPHLNSPNYYSVYPPVNQFLFRLTALATTPDTGILILKTIILIGNALLFFALHALSSYSKMHTNVKWTVLLNPLCIVETSGNLHFEALTLALFLIGLYFLVLHKKIIAGIAFGLAVSVKLIPLLFLPFVFKHFGARKNASAILSLIGTLLLTSFYFLNQTVIHHFFSSVNLYFQSFEFNASVYSIINAGCSFIAGHNTIHVVGPICIALFLLLYGYLLIRYKSTSVEKLYGSLFLTVLLFYTLSTTVHPWYALYPFVLGTLAMQYNSVAISYFVFLSYGFYLYQNSYTTSLLISIEYIGIILFLFHPKIKTYIQQLLPAHEK